MSAFDKKRMPNRPTRIKFMCTVTCSWVSSAVAMYTELKCYHSRCFFRPGEAGFCKLIINYTSIPWGGGGGRTPLYKPNWYLPPHQVGFLRRFGLETVTVYTLPILLWNRVWFSWELRSVWTYLPFQFQISKKEREICEFEMDLNN